MACYHPLKGYPVGINEKTGKTRYKIFGYQEIPFFDFFDRPFGKPVDIPCGKCIGCRLAYSRQWADRCMLEATLHEKNWFLTLTYDDLHVPISFYGDSEIGEAVECFTLRSRDLQLWLKRFRFKFGSGIRFYACGEYGDKTFRPHYHVLIFGCDIDDLTVYKMSRGNLLYNSKSVTETWGLGHVVIAELTWETCAYTARYVMKKAKGLGAAEYDFFNIEPEFVRMSRRPGIAHDFYEASDKSIVRDGASYFVSTPKGGREIRPSRYFEDLYESEFGDDLKGLKMKRRMSAELARRSKLQKTGLDVMEYLDVEESYAEGRADKLLRGDV